MPRHPSVDSGEYALVTMKYKNRELGFAIRPELMDGPLIESVKALRYAVMENADLVDEEDAK